MYISAAPVPYLSPTLINHDSFLFLPSNIFFVVYFVSCLFPSANDGKKRKVCFCAGLMACDVCLPAADGKQFNILIIQCHLKVLKMSQAFSFRDIYTLLSSVKIHLLSLVRSIRFNILTVSK